VGLYHSRSVSDHLLILLEEVLIARTCDARINDDDSSEPRPDENTVISTRQSREASLFFLLV
jgi:hypothetical protein